MAKSSVTSRRGKPAEVVKTKPADIVSPSRPAMSAAANAVAGKSAEELSIDAGKLDAGRLALSTALDAAAAAQLALDALTETSSIEDRDAAQAKLDDARQAVQAAEDGLNVLTNSGESTNAKAPSPLPAGDTGTSAPATLPEGAAGADQPVGMPPSAPAPAVAEPGSAGGAVRPQVTHTPAAKATSGAGNAAGPAADLRKDVLRAVDDELSRVRAAAQTGNLAGAVELIDKQLADLAAARDFMSEAERLYLAERKALTGHGRLPRQVLVVTAKTDGRWRAGRSFGKSAVRIDMMELSGAEVEAITGDPLLEASIEDDD